MAVLNREALRARVRLATLDVPAPELGLNGDGAAVTIRLRELSSAEFEAFTESAVVRNGKESKAKPDFNRRLVQASAVDEAGEPLFPAGDEGLALVGSLTEKLVIRLAKAASELSGLAETDADAVKN